jgi:hypothetical protein
MDIHTNGPGVDLPRASTDAPNEPLAIIGIGCRFPGGANDPETFWKVLVEGVDAITEIPADRWHVRSFYDPEPGKPGKTRSRWGGFLPDVDRFDPQFFGIAPREAARMDPQQRLLLEAAWEALEDGGQPLSWPQPGGRPWAFRAGHASRSNFRDRGIIASTHPAGKPHRCQPYLVLPRPRSSRPRYSLPVGRRGPFTWRASGRRNVRWPGRRWDALLLPDWYVGFSGWDLSPRLVPGSTQQRTAVRSEGGGGLSRLRATDGDQRRRVRGTAPGRTYRH